MQPQYLYLVDKTASSIVSISAEYDTVHYLSTEICCQHGDFHVNKALYPCHSA